MDFTFLTCTYNHSDYIIMHLESVKFQVVNYFINDNVTLIIADDGSIDQTLRQCKSWCKENKKLFSKIMILGDGKNRGTCSNFLNAMSNVEDTYFYFLAGDDVYGYNNLKNALHELETMDLLSAPCPAFYLNENNEYNIENRYNNYKSVIAKGTGSKLFRRLFTIEGCLVEAAPTIYKSELIDENVKNHIGKCTLIEDQPMIYTFFKNNNIKMKYLEHSYVMYRINPNSISHTQNSAIKNIAKKDLKTLCDYYLENERNPIYRYALFIRKQVINGKRWMMRLYPSYLYVVVKQNIFNHRAKKLFRKCIINEMEAGINHLNYLREKSHAFKCMVDVEHEQV